MTVISDWIFYLFMLTSYITFRLHKDASIEVLLKLIPKDVTNSNVTVYMFVIVNIFEVN